VISILLGLILVLATNMILLGRFADKYVLSEPSKKPHHGRHALYLTIGALLIAIASILSTSFGMELWQQAWRNMSSSQQATILRSVSGSVVDKDNRPVNGVTLTAGDTLITTGGSGMYSFTSVSQQEGIRLSHPELALAINKEVQSDGKMDILFDIDVMKSLIDVARLEAKGDTRTLYKQLFVERLKSAYSQDKFVNEYKARFTPVDLASGTIYIGNTSKVETYQSLVNGTKFTDLVRVEVFTGYGTAEYLLTKDQGKWKLVF